jgi:hypothetical protein
VEIRWVYAVIHERSGPVSPRVIGAEESGIGRDRCPRAKIAVNGEQVGNPRSRSQKTMRVQQVDRAGKKTGDIEFRAADQGRIERDHWGFRYARPRKRKQRDPMAELYQASRQPDDYPLRAAIPVDW